jgi:hypothetical protein
VIRDISFAYSGQAGACILALIGLTLAAAALLTASDFGLDPGAPTSSAVFVALLLAGFKDRAIFLRALKEVSWSILPLVAGILFWSKRCYRILHDWTHRRALRSGDWRVIAA